jgi:ABC-type transport system involved in Fe-S cluster assembly fused permease/ATPase subunit
MGADTAKSALAVGHAVVATGRNPEKSSSRGDPASFMIAHRLSTFCDADLILDMGPARSFEEARGLPLWLQAGRTWRCARPQWRECDAT